MRVDDYIEHRSGGVSKLEHVAVAERALGKPLPVGTRVHHLDENRSNNAGTNLVICPDEAYHQLLHQRQRALDSCGNANWRRCMVCKQYDEPSKLYVRRKSAWHRSCRNAGARAAYQPKKGSR